MKQMRSFILQPNHDGKELRCVYDHEAYNQHDPSKTREASIFLTVEGKLVYNIYERSIRAFSSIF